MQLFLYFVFKMSIKQIKILVKIISKISRYIVKLKLPKYTIEFFVDSKKLFIILKHFIYKQIML